MKSSGWHNKSTFQRGILLIQTSLVRAKDPLCQYIVVLYTGWNVDLA